MHTFIKNYLHFIKNCIRPPVKKLKSLKSGFMKNSNFENNRVPCTCINITRIVKAASHKLPGKSSLNVPSRPVLSRLVLSRSVLSTMTMSTMRKLKVIRGSWRLYTRKLEVVHKEVGGCT